jgi:hypothetical protein
MVKRVTAILALVIVAVLLTYWYLQGLSLLPYLFMEVAVVVAILSLALSIARLAEPTNDRIRHSRRSFTKQR